MLPGCWRGEEGRAIEAKVAGTQTQLTTQQPPTHRLDARALGLTSRSACMDQLLAARAQLQATLAASNAAAAAREAVEVAGGESSSSDENLEDELLAIEIGGTAAPSADEGSESGPDAGTAEEDELLAIEIGPGGAAASTVAHESSDSDSDTGTAEDATEVETTSEEDEDSDSSVDEYYCDLCAPDTNGDPKLITGKHYRLRDEPIDVLGKKKLALSLQKLCKKFDADSIEDLCDLCFIRSADVPNSLPSSCRWSYSPCRNLRHACSQLDSSEKNVFTVDADQVPPCRTHTQARPHSIGAQAYCSCIMLTSFVFLNCVAAVSREGAPTGCATARDCHGAAASSHVSDGAPQSC